jgi:hypothetical protein
MDDNMKYLALTGLLFAALVFEVVNTTPVEAQWPDCPHRGHCPPGTCMNYQPGIHGEYACNVANCSAANCSRQRVPPPGNQYVAPYGK